VPALRALAGTFSEQTGLAIRLDAPDEIPQLTDDASLALYRALQEALSNVARHSGASSVIVHLSIAGDAVRLSVTDNGRGFPARAPAGNGANASSYGLTGMRERIAALRGSLAIEPSRPTGAAVTVTLPLEHVSRP
jgi:signal transduction histidine kinase